jgi:CHRD domain
MTVISRTPRLVRLAAAAGLAAALLLALGIGSAQSQSSSSNKVQFAKLTGQAEIGEDGEPGAGDPNGRGSAAFLIKGGRLCYGINVSQIGKPNAAHIHAAPKGENGDIVVPLKAPSAGNPGSSTGCKSVDADLLGRIADNPSNYYVNVHNSQYPNGAVRGQLFPR